VAVVTDSTADLPRDLARDLGITVVPLTVMVEGQSYLDGVEITPDDFYRRMRASSSVATTSQPSPGRFAQAYEELLESHDEILSLHLPEHLSGTFSAAQEGAKLVAPGRIEVIDSGLVSMPLGLAALAAARLSGRGLERRQLRSELQPVLSALRVYFTVGTLEYLRRGGRIGTASALLGGMLQIKPVLTLRDGQVAPLERVRTSGRALERLYELTAGAFAEEELCVIVGHADAQPEAKALADRLSERSETLLVLPLGPVVGAHAGPGTIGIGVYPARLLPLGLGTLNVEAAT